MKNFLCGLLIITLLFSGSTAFALVSGPISYWWEYDYSANDNIVRHYIVIKDNEGNEHWTDCVFQTALKNGKPKAKPSMIEQNVDNGCAECIIEGFMSTYSDKGQLLKNFYKNYSSTIILYDSNNNSIDWNDYQNLYLEWYRYYYEEADGFKCLGRIYYKGKLVTMDSHKELRKTVFTGISSYKCDNAYMYGYTDKIMAPNESLSKGEISQMIYRLIKQNDDLGNFNPNKTSFEDTKNEWFSKGIEYIYYKEGFKNPEDNFARPYNLITRGEAFKYICLGLNFSENNTLSFKQYANILSDNKIIQGDNNGNLNLYNNITRAEMCAIFNRIIGRNKVSLTNTEGEQITAETYGFIDLSPNDWYYEDMLKATSAYNGKYVDMSLRQDRNTLDN